MPSAPPPPPPSAAKASTGRSHKANTYSVLLERHGVCTPAATATSLRPRSFPTIDAPTDGVVELSCRLVLRHGQVQLHLAFHPPQSPTKTKHHASYAEIAHHTTHTRSLGGAAPSRSPPASVPLTKGHTRVAEANSGGSSNGGFFTTNKKAKSKHGAASSASSSPPLAPATATGHHSQLTQHYTIAVKEVAPIAALLPLSAELRSHLHLNLVDADAVTYSSHSTPRAVGMSSIGGASSGSPGVPAPLSTNFVLPPGRVVAGRNTRTRDSSLSARGGGSSSGGGGVSFFSGQTGTAATYGQYLDASEPYRYHPHSLPTQTAAGRGARAASLPAGAVGTEADATRTHHFSQHRGSPGSSSTSSRLLTPLQGNTPAPQTLPDTSFVATPRANAVLDYAELFSVAVFGVTTTAGVRNCSFSLDEQGHVLVDKKSKKFSYRKLLGWMLPSKKEFPRMHSASSLSSRSTHRSEAARTPTTPVYPSYGKPPLHSKSHPSHTPAHSPVLASDAHVDPHDVLDLPFALSETQTFQLRFRDESDVRRFLTHYVELQTRAKDIDLKKKKAAAAAVKKPKPASSRALGGPLSSAAWPEGSHESLQTCERASRGSGDGHDDDESDHSPSTAPYNEYPRNIEALGGGVGAAAGPEATVIFADDLYTGSRCTGSGDASADCWTDTVPDGGANGEEAGGRGSSACSTPVPTFFFGGRGWPEYVRHLVDPRYGLPFATVPLFLWHALLPLAASVLYSCDRGFLVVERLPPPSSPVRSEDGASTAGSGPPAEASREHLNHLVSRLLTPIRTAHPTRATPASQLQPAPPNRHGVVEVLPATSGPADVASDSASSSGSSWDGVKLVLPVNDDAAIQPSDDHFTTFKDVFLCLSETHLLFLNSFGHLRFQCSFDEIAIITHSASTEAFPTYPFIRFRLKSSDAFGAPSFVLTFTLLPNIPCQMRAATTIATAATAAAAAAAAVAHTQRGSRGAKPSTAASSKAARPSLSSPIGSVSASASWSTKLTPGASLAATPDAPVTLLEDEEKVRLLRRHKALLTTFETVCPRQLEKCAFSDMIGGEHGRVFRARVPQLISQTSAAVSGSPVKSTASRGFCEASPWMAQQYNTNAILCIAVEADDISVAGSGRHEGSGDGEGPSSAAPLPMPPSRSSSGQRQQRRGSRQLSLPASAKGTFTHAHSAAAEVTPRWGRDDPGILLQDAGHDMDFSLERATRSMPLLALKQEVCDQCATSQLDSGPHSYYPSHADAEPGPSNELKTKGNPQRRRDDEDAFVPMMPKKRGSRLVHRAAMHD